MKVVKKILSIPLRILTLPLEIVNDLMWFADEYKGFLHWISIHAYLACDKLNEIIADLCGNSCKY